jgi:putative holliday junction resolvase
VKNDPLPPRGRLAGIDHGKVRIGIAICDPDRTLASPLETYQRRDSRQDADYFRRLSSEERIVGFVIGAPVHLSGAQSGQSVIAEEFGAWLRKVTNLPVRFADERFTSAMADQWMAEANLTRKRRKDRRDMLAAQAILSGFLESSGEQEQFGGLDDLP